MKNEVKKLTEVAIVGVGCTGFETVSPDVSYKEMMCARTSSDFFLFMGGTNSFIAVLTASTYL